MADTDASERQRGRLGLYAAAAVCLAMLLVALAADTSAVSLATLATSAGLSVVLGATFIGGRHEHGELDLSRRLGTFRQQVDAAGDEPERDDVERLIALARELQLPEEEIAGDLARLRAWLPALDLRDQLRAGVWPTLPSPDPGPSADACHFLCPVRFGRRRADQYGHLVLTRLWLQFRGALDMSVAWSEIASVERAGRDIIASLHDSHRVLRFSCHTLEEAARAGVLAAELSRRAAAVAADGSSSYQTV